MSYSLRDLEAVVCRWPDVDRRTTKTQLVFSTAGRSFCWLSPANGMVQLPPALGRDNVTRRLERHGAKVKVVRQRTGNQDAEYYDPGLRLEPRFSYPGFMCSRAPQDEAESLVRQAYEQAQRGGHLDGGARLSSTPRRNPPSASKVGMTAKVIQVPMEEALVQMLDFWSQKFGRSRADVIREACRRYLKRAEREDLDRNYREGYDRFPEEPIMARTQVALITEVLPTEEW